MRLSTLILLVGVVLLGSGLVTAQQSLLASQGRVIAFSGASGTAEGELAPETALERLGGTAGADVPVVGDDGRLFFRAQLVDVAGAAYPYSQSQVGRLYYLGDSRGHLVKVLRGGDQEPSGLIPAAALQPNYGGMPFTGTPRMSSSGLILFGAAIWDNFGGATTSANDTALYLGTPGNWQMVAQEGGVAPGASGAMYAQTFSAMSHADAFVSPGGTVVFYSSLTGQGVTSVNNAAWFAGVPGSIQLVVRKGDVGPTGEIVSSIGAAPQINAYGQIAFDVSLAAAPGTLPLPAANDRALWLYTPGAGMAQLLREGDASPIPGVVHGSPAGAWAAATGSNAFNSKGEILINSDLSGAVAMGVDDRALLTVSASGQSLVMRRNDAAPGVPGARLDAVDGASLQLDDSGRVAFQCSLVNGGVTAANDTGIWAGFPGSLMLIAREGDAAPGAAGQIFGNLSGVWMAMNGSGQIVFASTLSGGGSSLWVWDAVRGLEAVQLPGDAIEVLPGLWKTASSVAAAQSSNGASRALGFANDGTLALRVAFAGGSSAIMAARVGSMTGIPARISATTGGSHRLLLNAGAANAGRCYVVAGSTSGVFPGVQIGMFNVPINADWYTDYTLANANVGPFVNTLGILDADGRASAEIVIPPALSGFTGALVHHAFAVLDLGGHIAFASEPAMLAIVP